LPRLIHIPFVFIAAHVPWLLLLEDVVLRGGTLPIRRFAWIGVVLATASQTLAGFSPGVFLSLQIELAYLALSVLRFRPGWRAPSAWLLAKLLGLLCAAVQLVPTYEIFTLSPRASSSVDFILEESLQPPDLVQFISPYYFAGN